MADRTKARRSNTGLASMDPARRREIASKAGRSVPVEKRPFSQNHKLAAEAGRKGGEPSHGSPSRTRRTSGQDARP